ncbi:hypothetical protein [Streptomyces sp. NPDC050564]|uniref:hypothetical protein n=1 Tax=Streptomyces sp. NPDC050564 TaxID=3365631 RepID=UPI0037B1DF9A
MIVGDFSAKEKDAIELMDAAAAQLTASGARVVGRIVQRRGVSDGGVKKMAPAGPDCGHELHFLLPDFAAEGCQPGGPAQAPGRSNG